MDILIVAAIAENGVIGRGNALPWRLKSDMQHFRALTMGKPVIMGRKTYLSIGKPLAGRTTIVVSRDREFRRAGNCRGAEPRCRLRGGARRRAAARTPRRSSLPAAPTFMPRRCPLATRLVITYVHKRARRRCALSRRSIAEFGAKSPAMSMQRRAGDEAAFRLCHLRTCDRGGADRPPSAA